MSKITAINIENFMSIRRAKLEFDASGVLNICGYNDSGKSAITRLLEVLFYNAYSTEQVKFITDEETYWMGSLEFDDDVVISRYKYIDGKSMWEMHKNGELVYTNRLDNDTLAAMPENPEIIQTYLGVIQDNFTEEKLNVRRNTDKLFLITTTGGDNYKILNSVLQSDVLAEASRNLNEDKNKKSNLVANLRVTSTVLEEQRDRIQVIPDVLVTSLEQQLERLQENSGKYTRVSKIADLRNQINHVKVHEEVMAVDTARLEQVQAIVGLRNKTKQSIAPELPSQDIVRLNLLQDILQKRVAKSVHVPESAEAINLDRFTGIMQIGTVYNALYNVRIGLQTVELELQEKTKELAQLTTQYNLKTCKTCGTIVD